MEISSLEYDWLLILSLTKREKVGAAKVERVQLFL